MGYAFQSSVVQGDLTFKKIDILKPTIKSGTAIVKNIAVSLESYDVDEGLFIRGNIDKNGNPLILGHCGCGIIEEIDKDSVTMFEVGTPVLYIKKQTGTHMEYVNVNIESIVVLPKNIKPQIAAGFFWRAMQAYILLTKTYLTTPNSIILINNAISPDSTILASLATHGKLAGIIGIVPNGMNKNFNGSHFYTDIINTDKSINGLKLEEMVLKITDHGAHVLFDNIGGEDFNEIISGLSVMGMGIVYANLASEAIKVDMKKIKRKSLAISSPSILLHQFASKSVFKMIALYVLELFSKKKILVDIEEINSDEVETKLPKIVKDMRNMSLKAAPVMIFN